MPLGRVPDRASVVGASGKAQRLRLMPAPEPVWFLYPSSTSSSSWLAHWDATGAIRGYAPPGVGLCEDVQEPALGWRSARWRDLRSLERGDPPNSVEPLNFADVLADLPADSPPLLDWATEMMEAQIARLRWYVAPRPGDPAASGDRPPGVRHAEHVLRGLQRDMERVKLHDRTRAVAGLGDTS